MSKAPQPAAHTTQTVRDLRTGNLVSVRGVGALKGRLKLKAGLDLTKPIFEQVAKSPAAEPRTSKS